MQTQKKPPRPIKDGAVNQGARGILAMSNGSTFQITWHDSGVEPKVAPNPDYPTGADVDGSFGATPTCSTPLPYPARRCGFYRVFCRDCGTTVRVTTAGRHDDPRSLTLACRLGPGNDNFKAVH
jgi:hypothetical protein